MNDLTKMMMADATGITATDEEIKTISDLALKQLELEEKIETFTNAMELAKEELRNVVEFLLPNAMLAVGVKEIKLANGRKVIIKDDVYASMKKDSVAGAIRWLDENGLGGIVKSQVEVSFGRGEFERSKELVEFCKAHGFNASEKETVHPQTLKATVKEQLAQGVQFPDEFFSVHPVRKSVIK